MRFLFLRKIKKENEKIVFFYLFDLIIRYNK